LRLQVSDKAVDNTQLLEPWC